MELRAGRHGAVSVANLKLLPTSLLHEMDIPGLGTSPEEGVNEVDAVVILALGNAGGNAAQIKFVCVAGSRGHEIVHLVPAPTEYLIGNVDLDLKDSLPLLHVADTPESFGSVLIPALNHLIHPLENHSESEGRAGCVDLSSQELRDRALELGQVIVAGGGIIAVIDAVAE